ncbi:MAG: TIM barrel protein [Bacillota bacterium]|nr:TIM barrel protein [Bacillota bacterium]
MRFGGPVSNYNNPDEWINTLKQWGYSAAYCPVDNSASEEVIRSYAEAAEKADIVIAEVGAWSNPISRDDKARREAITYCQKQLDLAERIGARCCVNVAGSRGDLWDGPHPDNVNRETFDLIVSTVREIIDAIKPKRTFFTLEAMPWIYPYDADSYIELMKAIDRKEFAVHLDIVNVVSSPLKYYRNGDIIREWVKKLGPYVKSCHAKDILLSDSLTVHLDEVMPGTGGLDYPTLLREFDSLHRDTPLMLEHLSTEEEYAQAAANVRRIAAESGVSFVEAR